MPYMIIEKGGEGVIFTEKWKALFFFFSERKPHEDSSVPGRSLLSMIWEMEIMRVVSVAECYKPTTDSMIQFLIDKSRRQ